MLLGTLGATLLGIKGINRVGEGIVRAGYGIMEWIFNAASSFNQFWNTKILSKWA